jgi:hypothetical protein
MEERKCEKMMTSNYDRKTMQSRLWQNYEPLFFVAFSG